VKKHGKGRSSRSAGEQSVVVRRIRQEHRDHDHDLRLTFAGRIQCGRVVALGGTINLENSSVKTSGVNADGLHVFDAHSKIFGTNLTIATSGRRAAGERGR
jgi:hypothetical protein